MFTVRLTDSALDDLRFLKKNEQVTILNAVNLQLANEPLVETRNRKPLRPNELSQWELRVGSYRVFYDVDAEGDAVLIKAVGWKDHNTLWIRGKEYVL